MPRGHTVPAVPKRFLQNPSRRYPTHKSCIIIVKRHNAICNANYQERGIPELVRSRYKYIGATTLGLPGMPTFLGNVLGIYWVGTCAKFSKGRVRNSASRQLK